MMSKKIYKEGSYFFLPDFFLDSPLAPQHPHPHIFSPRFERLSVFYLVFRFSIGCFYWLCCNQNKRISVFI